MAIEEADQWVSPPPDGILDSDKAADNLGIARREFETAVLFGDVACGTVFTEGDLLGYPVNPIEFPHNDPDQARVVDNCVLTPLIPAETPVRPDGKHAVMGALCVMGGSEV